MTKLQIVGLIIVAGALGVLCAPRAGAVTVAPLSYAVELANGQQKKGFIDITNTEPTKTKYLFNVQAFRQLNSAGDLQFYENATIAQGILLDYATYELQPNQTLRLYFVADGTKLPAGDSFAAIFAEPAPRAGVASAAVARVGTILTIQNGTPTERKAQITKLAVPFVQIGSAITGNYSIKNTSDPTKSAGFVPQVELTVSPFRQLVRNKSSLVFAGIERQNDFSIQTGRFGFYKVTAVFGESKKDAWVFFATPFGLAVFTSVAVASLALVVALTRWLRSPKRGVRRKAKRQIPKRG